MNIINGDCLIEMRKMEDNSIDFICCDPPYGLTSSPNSKKGFMGKEWDAKVPGQEIWQEALRICKPGAMLAAFGGTRTHHHLMIALERSGWEIRDTIFYLYGSGFPKSNSFGKKLGGEWEGYGTALKPAVEPIILCMKPLDGTYTQNADKWGVAGINIDAGRIGIDQIHTGRWPANLIFDEEAAQAIDQQSGFSKSYPIELKKLKQVNCYGKYGEIIRVYDHYDSGGASRFFYTAKSSPAERNRGCEKLPLKEKKTLNEYVNPSEGRTASKSGSPMSNFHPCVKPLSLMKYIIKLLAPPGNPILLDPFAGSGSTLVAAKELGIRYIGIEISEEYCEIAQARISAC